MRHLQGQIALGLHERQGAAVTNFAAALEPADADQALQATKDPYVFDFLELGEDAQERDLEQALIADIQKFLLELGTGFAFYGRQRALLVGDQEFFLDLLFYHHALRRFVVIDLKIGKFQPEFVSKMNFYLNAVDEQLRLGVTASQAMRPILTRSLCSGMIPLIDSTKTTGLIFFPGTMVGMLLPGAAPVDTVRLQLILLYALLGSVALAAVLLAYRNFFTAAHQLHEPPCGPS